MSLCRGDGERSSYAEVDTRIRREGTQVGQVEAGGGKKNEKKQEEEGEGTVVRGGGCLIVRRRTECV